MSKAIAFLAGLGAGYMDSTRRNEDNARREKQDKREQDRFDAEMEDRRQTKADKDALRSAAAPAVVEQKQLSGPTMPGEESLPTLPKVDGRYFASQGVAEEEAAKLNTPGAARKRVSDALVAQGNVVGADQLRTSGLQADAAQMALDAGKRAEADQIFDDGLRKATAQGPDALAAFMSESHADGQQGAMKFKSVPSADGKSWQMHRIGEDGALSPIGGRFSNDENGIATAAFMLSRSVKPEAKLSHMLAVKEADRKAKHDDRTLDIAQQNADTNEQWRRDQARLTAAHYKKIEEGKATPGAPLQLTAKDMAEFDKDFSTRIADEFDVKNAPDDVSKRGIAQQRAAKTALGNSIFQSNATIGVPLTAGTVLQAMEMASDRKNIRIAQVNGVPHEAVVVNGQTVVTSGPMSRKPPATPGAAPVNPAAAPARPAAIASQGVMPAAVPQRPPAQPAIPADKAAVLAPLNAAVAQATAQLAAVAQSGDVQAIARYKAAADQARAAQIKEATRQLGPQEAQAYIATLPQ